MKLRNAMIIGSIGLTSIVGCKKEESVNQVTAPAAQQQNYTLQIPTNLNRDSAISTATPDIDNDGDEDLIVAVHDASGMGGKVTIYTFKNDGNGNYK